MNEWRRTLNCRARPSLKFVEEFDDGLYRGGIEKKSTGTEKLTKHPPMMTHRRDNEGRQLPTSSWKAPKVLSGAERGTRESL